MSILTLDVLNVVKLPKDGIGEVIYIIGIFLILVIVLSRMVADFYEFTWKNRLIAIVIGLFMIVMVWLGYRWTGVY